jgi:uncharacterized membrane protein YesL
VRGKRQKKRIVKTMGIFFSNYGKAGPGIAKNAPKKRSFFRFWELFFRKFWKLLELSLLTFVLCLPVVTIGPAIAGMTKVLRSFSLEKSIFMMHDFWRGFKENWKKSLPVGLADVLVLVSVLLGLDIYPKMSETMDNGIIYIILCVISVSFGFTLLLMNFYIFPMIIATELSLREIIKNSFFLTCMALLKNLLTLIIIAAITVPLVIGIIFHPLTAILVPVIYLSLLGFIIVYRSYPVIQKFVIDPYYKARGEENPEYNIGKSESTLFTDKGGTEAPIKPKSSKKTIS